jgi:hypothetical protein
MSTRTRLVGLAAAAFLSANASAYGQAQRPAPPQQPDPRNTIPEKIEPAPRDGNAQKSLSDELDATGGVIRPPSGVDPEIQAPAPEPNPGTMPVIPPPGSPGGDPNVRPK